MSAIAREAKACWGYPAEWLMTWREDLTVGPDDLERLHVVTARLQGEIAGFYALEDRGTDWALAHLWVRPQSMRRGVGRSLFRDAIEYIRRRRPAPLEIDADPNAEGFYLQMGCRRVGSVPADMPGATRSLPRLVYEET